MPEETIDALKHFHRRREARLRQRLAATDDLVGKYWVLKSIYRNRKFEKQFLQKYLDIGGKSSTIKLPITEMDGGPGSGNHGHKGVPSQIGGSLPAATSEVLREAISAGQISTKLSRSKQSKHRKGSPRYQKAVERGAHVSYMTIDDNEVEAIVKSKAGTGKPYGSGQHFKETIDVGKPVGFYLSERGEEKETTRLTIHYGSKDCHVVPASPKKG